LENGSEFIVYYINSDMSAEDVLPEELSMDKKSIENSNEGWITIPYRRTTHKRSKSRSKSKSKSRSKSRSKPVFQSVFASMSVNISKMSRSATKSFAKRAKKERNKELAEKMAAILEVLPSDPEPMEEEYVKKVQAALVDFFREGYMKYYAKENEPTTDEDILDFINSVITKNRVKISGGFILKNMGFIKDSESANSIDVDIYVPNNAIVNGFVYSTMSKLFNCDRITEGAHKDKCKTKYFKASYTKKDNLFKKCGIESVAKYEKTIKGANGTSIKAEMDIVKSDNTTTPIQVIKNFDLTFCENWYDGKDIMVKDKQAILKEASGYLEPSYVPGFKTGNVKTRGRIAKYLKRGFRISYIDPETADIIEIKADNPLLA